MCVGVCLCMWKPEADIGIIIDDSSTVPNDAGCQSNSELAEKASLASQLAQRIPCFYLPERETN